MYPAFLKDELYAGYVINPQITPFVSSGGIISGILIELLEKGEIDGAIVSSITSDKGTIKPITSIATTREEILLNAGSSYIDTPVVKTVREAQRIQGRFAVVGLPCQVRALRSMLNRDENLRDKFFPIIGLFCRGNVTPAFYEDYLKSIKVDINNFKKMKISRKYLGGLVEVELKTGDIVRTSFSQMNAYRMVGIHAKPLCSWCDEHRSFEADISVGDIFSKEFRQKENKHSAFIPRNQRIIDLLTEMQINGKIKSELVGIENYQRVFRRTERFSNDLAPRIIAAKILGTNKNHKKPKTKTNPFHVFAWMMYFFFHHLSQSEKGRKFVFSLPSPVIVFFAYLYKGLSRL